jgi:hypothetical protein
MPRRSGLLAAISRGMRAAELGEMQSLSEPERRRTIHKLVRELVRAEDRACEHAERMSEQATDTPPTRALRAVEQHVEAMRGRLHYVSSGYGVSMARARIRSTLSQLRNRVVENLPDTMRAYEFVIEDLREGLTLVQSLRGMARTDGLVGLVRWCDDWLDARRTLVLRAEAQLLWFEERELLDDA